MTSFSQSMLGILRFATSLLRGQSLAISRIRWRQETLSVVMRVGKSGKHFFLHKTILVAEFKTILYYMHCMIYGCFFITTQWFHEFQHILKQGWHQKRYLRIWDMILRCLAKSRSTVSSSVSSIRHRTDAVSDRGKPGRSVKKMICPY